MRWGLLPPFVKDPKTSPPLINERAEGTPDQSAFRRAFAERRCLVPGDSFYEWTGQGARRPFLPRRAKTD
jgi:putative SOS response-associated peptidase YedK